MMLHTVNIKSKKDILTQLFFIGILISNFDGIIYSNQE